MSQSQHDNGVVDPVCGMRVNADLNRVMYLEMEFAFCSEQCKERFLANPGLYVGRPGEPAPKQRGEVLLKRRSMSLADPLPDQAAEELKSMLGGMMGVKSVLFSADRLDIEYDLLEATAAQIETAIMNFGVRLGDRWVDRFKRAIVHAVEEDVLASQEVSQSHGPRGCH